jgi:hypothetical protein
MKPKIIPVFVQQCKQQLNYSYAEQYDKVIMQIFPRIDQ